MADGSATKWERTSSGWPINAATAAPAGFSRQSLTGEEVCWAPPRTFKRFRMTAAHSERRIVALCEQVAFALEGE